MISGQFQIDLKPLEGLKRSIVSKVLRKGISEASKVVKTAVKSGAQNDSLRGYLAKSIGIKIKVYQGTAIAVIGPRSKWFRENGVKVRGKHKGEPRRYYPSKYAKLVEQGTKHSQAKPFLKPALDQTSSQYQQILCNSIANQIAIALA